MVNVMCEVEIEWCLQVLFDDIWLAKGRGSTAYGEIRRLLYIILQGHKWVRAWSTPGDQAM